MLVGTSHCFDMGVGTVFLSCIVFLYSIGCFIGYILVSDFEKFSYDSYFVSNKHEVGPLFGFCIVVVFFICDFLP
jgi:hypothetical protein